MNQQKIIDELISIEAFADELKKKATGLRAYLARVDGPAPKGGPLSPEEKNRILARRNKAIMKKSREY